MRIIIASGGSGGHIFPALGLAQALRRRGYPDIIFITDESQRTKDIIQDAGFRLESLSAPKMPYGVSIEWLFFIKRILSSYLKARRLIKNLNADIAIGFGAYISGITVYAAQSLRMKTLIHEQNVDLGRANKLLINKSDRACFTFENSLLGKNPKYRLTGNPVRQEILDDLKILTKDEAISRLSLLPSKKTLLVLGGSAGASAINRLLMELVSGLSKSEKEAIQIIQITGTKDFESVSQYYKEKIITCWVRDFYDRMGLLYKAADAVVCRCGATTITEISLFGIPAILIPYPGAGSHQKDNARVVAEKGMAVVLDQKVTTADELKMWIFGIISNKERMQEMGSAMRSISNSDAARRLADTTEELINAEQCK